MQTQTKPVDTLEKNVLDIYDRLRPHYSDEQLHSIEKTLLRDHIKIRVCSEMIKKMVTEFFQIQQQEEEKRKSSSKKTKRVSKTAN